MVSTTEQYRRRRAWMLDQLGGACAKCGSRHGLQIDHIDHMSKSFNISEGWSLSAEKVSAELSKCQALCRDCHLAKSQSEGSLAKGPTNEARGAVHGTVWGYSKYKCRCDECRAAKSLYEANLRARRSESMQTEAQTAASADGLSYGRSGEIRTRDLRYPKPSKHIDSKRD